MYLEPYADVTLLRELSLDLLSTRLCHVDRGV
jgi:hypothetical protein